MKIGSANRNVALGDGSPWVVTFAEAACASEGVLQCALMDPTPADAAHETIEGLLVVVAKAADDLKTFHAAISQARLAPLPPFPRAAMMMTVRVVDHLRQAERGLRDVLIALGLPEPSDSSTTEPL